MNFVILNSYVKVIYLRFIKNTYFYAVKNKIWKQLYWFFPNKKNYKMTSVRKSYTFQNLLKNITLLVLTAEKFGNIKLYQQTVLLKIIYDFRI